MRQRAATMWEHVIFTPGSTGCSSHLSTLTWIIHTSRTRIFSPTIMLSVRRPPDVKHAKWMKKWIMSSCVYSSLRNRDLNVFWATLRPNHFQSQCWLFVSSEFHDVFCFLFSLQFFDLIERNPIASSNLKLRALTIFAPTNQAFQRYLGNKTLVQYHMCKLYMDFTVYTTWYLFENVFCTEAC